MVSSWAMDIAQRTNLAVSAKAPIARCHEHARRRGWRNIRLLSSAGSTYNRDYHTGTPEMQAQRPIATLFVCRDGRIHHFWSSELAFAPRDPEQHPRYVDGPFVRTRSSAS